MVPFGVKQHFVEGWRTFFAILSEVDKDQEYSSPRLEFQPWRTVGSEQRVSLVLDQHPWDWTFPSP